MKPQQSMPSDDAGWRKRLTPEEYRVMREAGTEPPFSGRYWNEHGEGVYRCAGCGTELFSSDTKFDSGTGWPSFTEPTNREYVELREDRSQGISRVEVRCRRCGAHLGHVFDDGPAASGGKRFCINSTCLQLEPQDHADGNGQ
ncbi:MAG: peptide-methionine (R)-S-oxide reductase MsrB [bacterium]|nr:peptide-methionine (R)-S-oxide reductase MsrB [bacterium]